MPAAKLRPVGPMTTATPPVMYSQPWSPGSFDDGVCAAVANAEPLAGAARGRTPGRGRAVEGDVADQDVLLGHERGDLGRIDDDLAAGEPLADVVVGVAFERQRDPPRHEGAEALAGRAGELERDRVVGKAGAAVAAGQLAAQDRADRAVDVADRQVELDRLAPLEAPGAGRNEGRHVERLLDAVVLLPDLADGDVRAHVRRGRRSC